jgi:hypothetical protein
MAQVSAGNVAKRGLYFNRLLVVYDTRRSQPDWPARDEECGIAGMVQRLECAYPGNVIYAKNANVLSVISTPR